MTDRYAKMRTALPPAYVAYIETHNGWEGFPCADDDYVVLWDKEAIQENYAGYEMKEYLDPRWFVFGSDGGGEMLCFDLESGADAVFKLPFIGMSNESPILAYNSFRDLAKRIPRTT